MKYALRYIRSYAGYSIRENSQVFIQVYRTPVIVKPRRRPAWAKDPTKFPSSDDLFTKRDGSPLWEAHVLRRR
jgi:hypothetical protein